MEGVEAGQGGGRPRRLALIITATVATLALVIGAIVVGLPWLRESASAADMGTTEISGADPSDSEDSSSIEQELTAGTAEVRVADAGVHRTALARVTVDPTEDVVISERGSAVLTAAGGSGPVSATSFVAVRDGVITVESSSAVTAHLEVLALFDGGAETAGSLRLLPAAVQVVSTESEIGTDDLTVAQDVYVGGFAVPQGTPHALARITGTFTEPTPVTLSDQVLHFPRGTSTTTTVLSTVDDAVTLSAASAGELEIDVIGYVTAADATAPVGADVDSTTAGAVMGVSSQAPQQLAFTGGTREEIDLGALRTTAVIGLLSPGSGTAGAITSTYDDNAHHRGTAVTADAPRAGELVIVSAQDPQLTADVDVQAEFLPVAIVQPHEVARGEDVAVTMEPFPGGAMDAEHGIVRIEGTFHAPHRIASIAVAVNGEEVTPSAPLRLDGNGGTWHQDIIPARSGPLEITVTAMDVGGDTATATWDGTVTVPSDDDLVLSPQAQILTPEATAEMTQESAAVLSSAEAPGYGIGDVIVAGASDGLPDGTLGQVLALRYEQGRWLTILGPATLGNVILQGEFDVVLDRGDSDEIVQRGADGAEQPLTTPAPGAVPVGPVGGIGGGVGAAVPVAPTGAGLVGPGIAPALPSFPRMDGSAGKPREISTDETYDLLTHSCDEELESIPLASQEGKGTSPDGRWSLSGSAKLDLSVTCEAKLGVRVAYSAEYKPEGAIAVGLDAVHFLNTIRALEDDTTKQIDGVLTTAGSLFESDWTMSTSLLGSAEMAVGLSGSAKGDISTVDDEFDAHLPLARATFFLGPVPVTLDGDVTITPHISLNATGEFDLTSTFSGSVEGGLTLQRSTGITPLSALETDLTTTMSGTASATATASLAVEPALTLYKTISLGYSATPTAEATAKGEYSASDGSSFSLADPDATAQKAADDGLTLTTTGRRYLGLSGSFTVGLDLERELAAFPSVLTALETAGVPLEVTVVDESFAAVTVAEKTLWEYSYPEDLDPETYEPEIPEPDFSDDGAEVLAELEGKTFVFASGAGGWGTDYEMGADGTFTGTYHDSDVDVVRKAEFEGRFEVGEQIDETSYELELAEFTRTSPASGTEDADGYTIEYQDSVYGFDQCRDFRLLLPDTPTNSLTEGQKLWAGRHSTDPTLRVFAVTCYETDRGEDLLHYEMT